MASKVELTTIFRVGAGTGMTFGAGVGIRVGVGTGVELTASVSLLSRPVSTLFLATEVDGGAGSSTVFGTTVAVEGFKGERSSKLVPSLAQAANNASPAAISNPLITDLALVLGVRNGLSSGGLFG
jgi:hypothetical protein